MKTSNRPDAQPGPHVHVPQAEYDEMRHTLARQATELHELRSAAAWTCTCKCSTCEWASKMGLLPSKHCEWCVTGQREPAWRKKTSTHRSDKVPRGVPCPLTPADPITFDDDASETASPPDRDHCIVCKQPVGDGYSLRDISAERAARYCHPWGTCKRASRNRESAKTTVARQEGSHREASASTAAPAGGSVEPAPTSPDACSAEPDFENWARMSVFMAHGDQVATALEDGATAMADYLREQWREWHRTGATTAEPSVSQAKEEP